MSEVELFQRVATALFIGILIGLERGWQERDRPSGSRVAGIRTFAISGLLGAVWMLLAERLGVVVLGFAFVAFAGALTLARLNVARHSQDYGATTLLAAFLTFALGALAATGEIALASAAAVITALLLGVKRTLHRWLERIAYDELLATLKLLAITLVLLPVLPDKGYGPWQAFNPFEFWLMVVLISTISFAGYVAIKLIGPRRGVIFASLAGGLVSSTAVALNFARLARDNPPGARMLAGGIALASAMMFVRTAVIIAAIQPSLLLSIAPPAAMGAITCAIATLIFGRSRGDDQAPQLDLKNPFEFGLALRFGLLLALVMLATRAAESWAGEIGIYALAPMAGLTDVDAIALSYARLTGDVLLPATAAIGIALAMLSNTAVKAAIAATVGPPALRLPVIVALGLAVVAVAIGLLITIFEPAVAGLGTAL